MGTEWRTTNVYVDSGSMYTVLPISFFPSRLDVKIGSVRQAASITGHLLTLYLHDCEIQLGQQRFFIPVGFSSDLRVGFNILGRKGVFDRYAIEFNEQQKTVAFAPQGGSPRRLDHSA